MTNINIDGYCLKKIYILNTPYQHKLIDTADNNNK